MLQCLVGVSGPEFWKSGKEPEFLYVGPDFCDSGQMEIFGKFSQLLTLMEKILVIKFFQNFFICAKQSFNDYFSYVKLKVKDCISFNFILEKIWRNLAEFWKSGIQIQKFCMVSKLCRIQRLQLSFVINNHMLLEFRTVKYLNIQYILNKLLVY